MVQHDRDVRYVPKADIRTLIQLPCREQNRQRDAENCTTRVSRRRRKLSGMSVNNHPAKGKPQPHSVGFRGNEGIEDAFRLLWVNPRARVLDRHDDFIAATHATDLQNPMIIFVCLDCLNCVADQVEEDLL